MKFKIIIDQIIFLCVLIVKGVDKRMNPLELQGDDIEKVVLKYSNMIFKICLVLLCNEHDAKDAVQDT